MQENLQEPVKSNSDPSGLSIIFILFLAKIKKRMSFFMTYFLQKQ